MAWSVWGMSRTAILAGLAVSCVVVACATGGGAGEDETQNGPSGGMGGSIGGNGGVGNIGGATSMGGGNTCEELPCKLVDPQCGCDADEKCTWSNDSRSCVPNGTAAIGEVCGASTVCAAGGHCLTVDTLAVCKKYCSEDADCAQPGGLCALQVTNSMTMMPFEQKWCSDNCDLVSSVGCDAPNSKCELGQEQDGLMRLFTLCFPHGAGVQNDPCEDGMGNADTTLCAAGFACTGLDVNGDSVCLQWCNYTTMTGCSAGSCTQFPTPLIIGTVQYGACL